MKLDDPTSAVPKIGPKYQNLLTRLDIFNVGDLLYHFPFRYNDFSVIKNISELEADDAVTVKAELVEAKNIFTRNRKRLTRAKFSDKTGEIEAIWFNMHFIKKGLKEGEMYSVSGKVTEYNNKLTFMAPEVELEGGGRVNTGRLVPVYPETSGVSSKWLRTRINDVMNVVNKDEFLPDELIQKYKLIGYEQALNQFHFPTSLPEVDEAKERFAYEEMFMELLKVEDRKHAWSQDLEGHTLKKAEFAKKYNEIVKNLPFELSESQKRVLNKIFADFDQKHPMNRLLEGDVGSGKTVVAALAAYLTYLNGYKTLYMAPTEILAKQHFETFQNYLAGSGVNIGLKTSTNKKYDEDADILIGTHALLYIGDLPAQAGKVDNVALIVIDEQQRFGVEQRSKLMDMGNIGKVPHLLTMTATPIPRTLALTLYGDLAISSIEPPKDKYKNIKTWIVGNKKRDEAFEWIKKQNTPTFVVCPLIDPSFHETLENVKSAEEEYEKLKNGVFKGKKIGLLHGRMKTKEKEEAVDAFRSGKLQILVATPVIEVGIDIPDATIIVIESAERYGLTSLHQLRGRIGRAGQEAFCMLFMSKYSRNGITRLKNLEKHTSGLKLAEIDMKLRGRGDIYGTRQHGFVTFKVADPNDFELLEKAKLDAQTIFPQIATYPKLLAKLREKVPEMVGNN